MNKLFYVIGASGAGKDTLINFARTKLNGSKRVIFAHRYITRPAFAGSENHVYLSPEEFSARITGKLFSLYWESHGYQYGIGAEMDVWMAQGYHVVVNGSRQYLPAARQLYPQLEAILVTADPDLVTMRLAGRGRESTVEIERRIARTAGIDTDLKNCIEIENNGETAVAGNKLLAIIT